ADPGRGAHVRDVLPRDHQDVRGRLRVDVAEGYGPLALADDLGGHLARHDLAEQAIGVPLRHLRPLPLRPPSAGRGRSCAPIMPQHRPCGPPDIPGRATSAVRVAPARRLFYGGPWPGRPVTDRRVSGDAPPGMPYP